MMLFMPQTKLAFLSSLTLLILSVFADNEIGVMFSLKASYPDWQPRGIVDVGANRGGWTTNAQGIYPGVKTFMVEASPSHTGILDETKKKFENIVDFEIAVLSETDGKEVSFFDLDNGFGGTGNSMFQEKSQHYDGMKPDVRIVIKLDTLPKKHSVEYVDYLKLDVQVKLNESIFITATK
jgi:FkbM family methyltransferase